MTDQTSAASASAAGNPFLKPWDTPLGMPPFAEIRPEHFRDGFAAGLAEHEAEIAAIAGNPAAADFANTIEALEAGGRTLRAGLRGVP